VKTIFYTREGRSLQHGKGVCDKRKVIQIDERWLRANGSTNHFFLIIYIKYLKKQNHLTGVLQFILLIYYAHIRTQEKFRRPQTGCNEISNSGDDFYGLFPLSVSCSISSRRGSRLAFSPTHCPVRSTSVTHAHTTKSM